MKSLKLQRRKGELTLRRGDGYLRLIYTRTALTIYKYKQGFQVGSASYLFEHYPHLRDVYDGHGWNLYGVLNIIDRVK